MGIIDGMVDENKGQEVVVMKRGGSGWRLELDLALGG